MERSDIPKVILTKVDRNIECLKDFPHITKSGKWITTKDGYWTGGFWVGLLWLCYKMTNNKKYKKMAYSWAKRLEGRRFDKTFDLGFLFYPSFVLGYEVTGDEYLRQVSLDAAKTLSTLLHKKSKFIYYIVDIDGRKVGRTIIDVMMNIPLLWWAFEETGDSVYYDVAYTHSIRTIEEFIRENYSTIHVVDFDLNTGNILRKVTVQGYSNESCWSRGQAWAIYGFTLAYKTTKDKIFLKTAEKLADYFIKYLPKDYIPYWDFNDPKKSVKDSSAAAIASSGLLTLSSLSRQEKFKEIAIRILNSLSKHYLANENEDGILKHGCFHKPAGIGVDECLIWGDYYFMEALMKIRGELE